jgi:hypothetical protein
MTDDNKVVYYKGSTPPSFDGKDWISVKGTVKHSEYKGTKQTFLQRIKIVNS